MSLTKLWPQRLAVKMWKSALWVVSTLRYIIKIVQLDKKDKYFISRYYKTQLFVVIIVILFWMSNQMHLIKSDLQKYVIRYQ